MTPDSELVAAVDHTVQGRNARLLSHGEIAFTCPNRERHANRDAHPSARWNREKGVWHCDVCGAGGGVVDLARRLGLTLAGSGPSGGRGAPLSPPRARATVQPGLTLAQYAAAKQLPVDFLRGLGLSDVFIGGQDVVRIPYLDEVGNELAVRFRVSLDGDQRFKWRTGATPHLYGLARLAGARRAGEVLLVEGESDTQTLWFNEFHALGLPGAASWRPEWAAVFDGIERIYVLIEPDRGGDAVLRWLASVPFRARVRLVHLVGAKDVSGLYLADPTKFRMQLLVALDGAEPFHDAEQAQRLDREAELWATCAPLARAPRLLARAVAAVRALGVVRERRAVELLTLALVSRLLDKPVSVALKGPSAAGKSFTVERVLQLFPASAAYALTAMSERALAYDEEPLAHRMLVLYEAAGLRSDFASYLVRSLLSEGRVRYVTVEKTKHGLRPRLIEREGPTALVVTTTALRLHPENETRLLSVPVTDTREQTTAVLDALAADGRGPVDLTVWHALHEWLELGERRVVIPYTPALVAKIPPVAVRLRRDIPQVLALIQAHALLHRASRSRDAKGRIEATLEDYAVVRRLVEPLVSAGVGATVPATIRETVAAVEVLGAEGVSVRQVAVHLRLDRTAAWRRVQRALDEGYLCNREERRGQPARLELGEPLQVDVPILPVARDLRRDRGGASSAFKSHANSQPSSDSGCTVAGVLDGIDCPSPPAEPEADEVWDVP
jgi:hypothetical protein